jgi:hypothetical protein
MASRVKKAAPGNAAPGNEVNPIIFSIGYRGLFKY